MKFPRGLLFIPVWEAQPYIGHLEFSILVKYFHSEIFVELSSFWKGVKKTGLKTCDFFLVTAVIEKERTAGLENNLIRRDNIENMRDEWRSGSWTWWSHRNMYFTCWEIWGVVKNVVVSKRSQTRSILPDIVAKVLTIPLICSTLSNSNQVKNEKRGKK